ncbi:MAG: hypothetical protein K1X64_03445 [Myxococcaceae bacterium]|nr:hypothetical protein [Myxococcaceae bacterium]
MIATRRASHLTTSRKTTDARAPKSKRRFATSSRNRPLKKLVFFIDRNLGRGFVADALRKQDRTVELHDDHFAQDCQDVDWLPVVGALGWIVLTRDQNIRRNNLEREAFQRAGARVFVLTVDD